jgi:hypothetical protein
MAEEKKVHGIPHGHFDGYDGGTELPAEFISELLKGAPPEIKARAAEFAKERATKKDE